MGIGLAVMLILCGALGAASFIVSKRPDAKDAIAKLAPAQGIIGTIGAVSALLLLLQWLSVIGASLKAVPVYTIVGLVGCFALLGTGFLLGFPWFMSFNKNADAAAKADQLRSKIVPYQTPMGLTCIVVGVLTLILSFVHI